jgi:hypothetical protein
MGDGLVCLHTLTPAALGLVGWEGPQTVRLLLLLWVLLEVRLLLLQQLWDLVPLLLGVLLLGVLLLGVLLLGVLLLWVLLLGVLLLGVLLLLLLHGLVVGSKQLLG